MVSNGIWTEHWTVEPFEWRGHPLLKAHCPRCPMLTMVSGNLPPGARDTIVVTSMLIHRSLEHSRE